MKKIIKKLKSNSLFMFILGGLIFGSIGIYGTNNYQSNTIEYSPTDASWEVSNVSEAINSLYSIKTELDDIKSIGDATASQILKGKTAVVKGSKITGTASSTKQVSGSFTFEGPGDNEVETDSITFPTSGYSTLKVTTSNYAAGRITLSIYSSTGTKSLAHNGTVTIDVSNDDAVTLSCATDVTCSGSYVLTP